MVNNVLDWLGQWFQEQCDGDWEHEFTIKIATVDNPGWYVKIDLEYTSLEDLSVEYMDTAKEEDWYLYRIKDKMFTASGDPGKLSVLLEKFREIAEKHPKTVR